MSLEERSGLLPPKPGARAVDHFAGIVKTTLSVFGPASELFAVMTGPVLNRRQEGWFEELRIKLNEVIMDLDGLTVESLFQNDEFISAFVQASRAALATNKDRKIEAFRNAVLNVANGRSLDLDKQAIFLRLVDQFEPVHLELLSFMENPPPQCIPKSGPFDHALYQVIASELTMFRDNFQLFNLAIVDLHRAGLIPADLTNGMAPTPRYPKWVTYLGEEFLSLIRQPKVTAPKP